GSTTGSGSGSGGRPGGWIRPPTCCATSPPRNGRNCRSCLTRPRTRWRRCLPTASPRRRTGSTAAAWPGRLTDQARDNPHRYGWTPADVDGRYLRTSLRRTWVAMSPPRPSPLLSGALEGRHLHGPVAGLGSGRAVAARRSDGAVLRDVAVGLGDDA